MSFLLEQFSTSGQRFILTHCNKLNTADKMFIRLNVGNEISIATGAEPKENVRCRESSRNSEKLPNKISPEVSTGVELIFALLPVSIAKLRQLTLSPHLSSGTLLRTIYALHVIPDTVQFIISNFTQFELFLNISITRIHTSRFKID